MLPPVQVVVLYAPEDAEHQAALVKHLAGLEVQRVISLWGAEKIGAGVDWRRVTGEYLAAARMILLLLSADFFASDVQDMAVQAERAGAELIPIRVRAYDWGAVPFDNLRPLPEGGTPVTLCPDRDLAWAEIAEAIRHRVTTAKGSSAAQPSPGHEDKAPAGRDALFVPRFQSRTEARAWLEERLLANRVIHSEFGPDGDYQFNPESEMASVWRRKVIQYVIPRNRQILAALDANASLLAPHEKATREMFRQHVDDQEAFHIMGNNTIRKRFPPEMEELFHD